MDSFKSISSSCDRSFGAMKFGSVWLWGQATKLWMRLHRLRGQGSAPSVRVLYYAVSWGRRCICLYVTAQSHIFLISVLYSLRTTHGGLVPRSIYQYSRYDILRASQKAALLSWLANEMPGRFPNWNRLCTLQCPLCI